MRPFTACRLREQDAGSCKCSGVVLHHLHVHQRHTCPPRQREPVASADQRIRRRFENPARTAGCHNHGFCPDCVELSSLDVKTDHTDATSIFNDEARYEPLFVDIQVVLQSLLVKDMQDSGASDCTYEECSCNQLSAEPSRSQSAIFAAAEDDAHAFKFDHRITSFPGHYFDSVLVCEIVATFYRV